MENTSRTPFHIKLVLLVVVVPLAIACLGGWQAWRAESAIRPLRAKIESIDETVARIEDAKQQAGKDVITLRLSGGKTMPSDRALRNLYANRLKYDNDAKWRRMFSLPMGGAAAVLGLAAACTGIFGLVSVHRAGRRALRSREALLQGFQEGLGKLPWLIGSIGFFIAAGLACAVAYEAANYILSNSKISGRLLVFGIVLAGLLLVFGFKLVYNIYRVSKSVFEREPMRLMGKSVSRADAPKVWAFVREVAQKAGAAMPEAIILGLDEGFFVTEHPVELMSGEAVPEGRVLYLPLPYMAYMTQAEAEAVIGHELGHFTGADTEYSLRFSPIYAAAVDNLRAVLMAADDDDLISSLASKPALMFGEYYLDSFDLAVQHWSRERELAADKMGASIAGGEAVALSLLRISVLAPHVYDALSECWTKGGRLPGGVLNRVRELVRERGLSDPAEHLEETQAHPTDSHPSTRQRIEAVGIAVTDDLLARARNVEESSLLRDLGIESDGAPDGNGETAPVSSAWAALSAPALSATLESEFSEAAKENAAEWDKHLGEAAMQGTGRTELYESPWFLSGLCIFALVMGIVIGGILFTDSPLAGALVALLGLVCIYPAVQLVKRSKKPYLVLTAEGFSRDGTDEIVPWNQVADYSISIGSTTFFATGITIAFLLEEGFEPRTAKTRRSRYKAKYRQITVSVSVLAKPHNKPEAVNEELFEHWRGGNARYVLASMKK